jgi:hypothetical protein
MFVQESEGFRIPDNLQQMVRCIHSPLCVFESQQLIFSLLTAIYYVRLMIEIYYGLIISLLLLN